MKMEPRWEEYCREITPADQGAMEGAQRRWDSIAKPLHGLGRLEDMVVHIAGATGSPELCLNRKAVAVFCADNGVVAEGVTQTGPEVTLAVAREMAAGRSTVCRMAAVAGAEVFPLDIGMRFHEPVNGLLDRSLMAGGTWNIAKGPAMPRETLLDALWVGIQTAEDLTDQGFHLLAAGEMGIGNTTTAAAVTSALLGCTPSETVGRGAGLSEEGLLRKREAVQTALRLNRPNPNDPLDVLCKVGGLDIAGMAGFYLGCAQRGVPVLLDGAISCAAALAAVRLCPNAKKAMLASHLPSEPCGPILLEALGLEPVVDAGMHLGEGTGAVAAMPLLDMAMAVYQGMTTFHGMGIGAYREDGAPVPGVLPGEAEH